MELKTKAKHALAAHAKAKAAANAAFATYVAAIDTRASKTKIDKLGAAYAAAFVAVADAYSVIMYIYICVCKKVGKNPHRRESNAPVSRQRYMNTAPTSAAITRCGSRR